MLSLFIFAASPRSLGGGTRHAPLMAAADSGDDSDDSDPLFFRTADFRTMSTLHEASRVGDTELVKQLLDGGAPVDKKQMIDGMAWMTPLMLASRSGRTKVVQLLLDRGASIDEKDTDGRTALVLASMELETDTMKLLLLNGAIHDFKDKEGDEVVRFVRFVALFDEDQLGRMVAAQVHRRKASTGQASTGTAVLQLVSLAGFARDRARKLRSSDPRLADDHLVLFARLQLAAAACVKSDEIEAYLREEKLFDSDDGGKALDHAVQIEAKELLAQPVVQEYIKVAWRGNMVDLGWGWALFFPLLLLQLLFFLPLVALLPALEPWVAKNLEIAYLLRLPVVKFGLECAADLALALVLTFIPATDLATAPAAPLLLVWVGSGLLWEARQLMSSDSDASSSWNLLAIATRFCDHLAAYWADHINRVDAMALIFSFAALVTFVSTGDSGDPTATSLRVLAVFHLWLRVIRVLLVSPQFGPFVMMFFRMFFGDVLYFLVLLFFLLVAFAASWTVLLEPQSSLIAGCADDLGGVDFGSTMLRLLEGALTGDDHFECARDSTNSPVAAWVITFGYVTLTAVLLLNMLIAMCAAARMHSATP